MPPLLLPFAVQLLLAVAAFFLAPRVARAPKPVWAAVAALSLACMFFWPLMRFFPVEPIRLLGAPVIACIELTGLAVPAVLFFGVASRHVPRKSDARALLLLTVVAALYFIRAGWWMLAPGVPALGPTRIGPDGVCRQSTGYTCVAASMVTMLRAHDIPADELEMARLAFTQVNAGATDSRTLWALQRKLAGSGLTPVYQRVGRAALPGIPTPFLVQIDWGFFVSHMVPVLEVTDAHVVLGDPLSGRREVPVAEFLRDWKGTAISLQRK